jgi:RNA polymerase sigma-70 factor (ECF subfamily)
MDPASANNEESRPPQDIVDALVANHREFLGFVQKRVGSAALAEDIVQDAFVRNLDKLGDQENAVAWFYRVLRNAIIDHYRRTGATERKLEAFAQEPEQDEELHRVVCKCVASLADTLKPEYAEALKRVEVDGVSVKDYADEAGISSSNAGVRIFRAREALRKQVTRSCGICAKHGCFDCSCDSV